MKMSPSCSYGMFQPGVAVVERNPSIESLVEMDLGPRETEAPVLGRDLEASPLPLHHVVVTDHALVPEGANARQVCGSGAPGNRRFARAPREAAVVVGNEATQDAVGRVQIVGPGQAQFALQTVLEDAPEAFDPTFGLRRVRRDEGDPQLLERAAELGGFAPPGQFFLPRPAVIVAHEDGAAISVESQRHSEAPEQALQQVKVALGRFGEEELGGQDFAGRVVLHTQCGELRAAALQPVVRRAVELHQFALAADTQTALAMSGRAAFARRAHPGPAEQTAHTLAAKREAFDLGELLGEMVVVEASIAGTSQLQDAGAHALGQSAGTGAAPAGVCQSRLTSLAIAPFQAF